MKFERMLITCGGTGGHFYPGLTIARVMKKQGRDVRLLLAGSNAAAQCEIARSFGIESVELPAMPAPRKSPLRFLAGVLKGYKACRREIRNFHPQAMLGMGSFTSLPAILAAKRSRLPLFLHDGNAKAGKANRILSRYAHFLAGAFPLVNADQIKCPVYITGMPVRPELTEAAKRLTKAESIARLNELYSSDLDPVLPTLLVFGGSQGAAVFNAALPEGLLQLERSDIQVLHLTGKGKLQSTLDSYKDAPFKRLVIETSEQMAFFWSAADIVFSRSGGSSIAELALFGKPAVLVPYPFAAEDHQRSNAECFSCANAGVVLDNYELSPDHCREILQDFLASPASWEERGKNAQALARPTAAEDLLEKIEASLSGF